MAFKLNQEIKIFFECSKMNISRASQFTIMYHEIEPFRKF